MEHWSNLITVLQLGTAVLTLIEATLALADRRHRGPDKRT